MYEVEMNKTTFTVAWYGLPSYVLPDLVEFKEDKFPSHYIAKTVQSERQPFTLCGCVLHLGS